MLLTSNLNEGNTTYDAQIVTFQCAITSIGPGTVTLTWISEEYIPESALRFSSAHQHGQTKNSSINPNTVATLVNNSYNPETRTTEMVSELRIMASSSIQNPTASVSCRVSDHGQRTSNTIAFCKADA